MRKVNMSVIRSWVVNKIGELIGLEDEVLVEYAMGMLENDTDPVCDSVSSSASLSYETLTDPRSQENADQPDGVPDKRYSRIYDFSMEAPP